MLQTSVVVLSSLVDIFLINWPQTTVLLLCQKSRADTGEQKTSSPKKNSVFPSFFLSLNEVYQDKTRLFYGWQVIVLRQSRCTHKIFTLYSTVDHCDGVLLNICYFTCFLKPFFKLTELLRMLQVENESMPRLISNKVS